MNLEISNHPTINVHASERRIFMWTQTQERTSDEVTMERDLERELDQEVIAKVRVYARCKWPFSNNQNLWVGTRLASNRWVFIMTNKEG